MTFPGHVAVTGLTLQLTNDPFSLVAANLIIHFALDSIPHAEWSTFRGSKVKAVDITLFDFAIEGLYICQVFTRLQQPPGLTALALVAGLWLDILDPLAIKFWPALHRLHRSTHTWPEHPIDPIDWDKTVTGKTPLWLKLVIQNALVAVSYWLLTRN